MDKYYAAILILGLSLGQVLGQTQPPYLTCAEGSDLIHPPQCPDPDPNPGQATYFPFPYDCRQYFECTNGIARCIRCPPETIWDQDLRTCNHEQVTVCNLFTTTPTPAPTTPTTTTPTTTTPTTTIPTTTTPTTTTPTTTIPTTTTPTTTTPTTTTPTTTTEASTTEDPATWVCPEGYLGFIRHPYDCHYFYQCDPARRPCLFLCPDDLFFNPILGFCDYHENVIDCVDGTPPPTSTTPRTSDSKQDVVPNYRNLPRYNFPQTINYVTYLLRGKRLGDNEDPCEVALKML